MGPRDRRSPPRGTRTRPQDLLNDSLVDFEIKFMQRMMEGEGKADNLGKCHIFNSFFYKRLLHCMGGYRNRKNEDARAGYQSVKRYAPSPSYASPIARRCAPPLVPVRLTRAATTARALFLAAGRVASISSTRRSSSCRSTSTSIGRSSSSGATSAA